MRTLVVCRSEAISDHVLSLVEMPAWFAYVLTSAHYPMLREYVFATKPCPIPALSC